MSMTDELRELEQLHASGELTDAEYERAKTKVIGGGSPLDSISPTRIAGWMSERQWAMILHLSHLLGYTVVPILGLATPKPFVRNIIKYFTVDQRRTIQHPNRVPQDG